MRHKRIFAAVLAALTCAVSLTGCGTPAGNSGAIQVVCTNFAEYDWVRQIIAGQENLFDVTYLLENGVDIHNYQPSAADMAKITGSDLFIYVGGESEQWVEDAFANAADPNQQLVRLLDAVRPFEEETVEGMEAEEEGDAPAYDEHVWLSVRNAIECTNVIAGCITALDPSHAKEYNNNTSRYCDALKELDTAFSEARTQTAEPTLIVADRFPFRYFAEDYDYSYYAAFAGCAAETEASFETIAFLSQKVDALGAKTIFTIEGGNPAIAESVRDNTKTKDQQIRTLNSLQSVTGEDIANGATYLSLMQENLNVLKEAAAAQ